MESLPASSRQLVRRRSGRGDAVTARSQRCRNPPNAATLLSTPPRSRPSPPNPPTNMAVVRPGHNTNRILRRDREAQRLPLLPTPKPPRQVLTARALGASNPYLEDQPARDRRSVTQRSRRAEVKTRNQPHPMPSTSRLAFGGPPPTFRRPAPPAPQPAPPCPKVRQNLRTVRAKVDSHLCPHLTSQPPPAPMKPPQPKQNKSMAEAHQQLELLLSRIERAGDYQPPPPPATQVKRRAGQGVGSKVAKGARRQMEPAPRVPAGSPMLSARRKSEEDRDHLAHVVPLVQNPQRLPPAKRDALLELLQRAGQHDKGIVDIVASSTGDPSRDTMLMLLQMLPLSLDESPYREKFWEGHRYLKERQQLHQQLRPGDDRFKEVKVLRDPDGRAFFSRTLEEELRDEKKLNERQEQAMRERAELERHKQLVIDCREQRRQQEQKMMQKSPRGEGGALSSSNRAVQPENPTADPWKQLLQDRNRFQANCNRSCFYNHSRSSAPWKIYAKVASKLSSQLIESMDVEFHRSVANYINDFVAHKCNIV
nr:bromodomain-containing protein 4 [Drosophila takahashii]